MKKHKAIVCLFLIMFVLSFCYAKVVDLSVSRFNGYVIVLDAGHGGRDVGSIGVNGTIEKEINLEYVLLLKESLVKQGYKVILTRKSDDGLYSEFAKNKKTSDMNARYKIIKKANPNLVISIHMNSFKSESAKGAMTYYRKGDKSGNQCADIIQKSIATYCGARSLSGKVGDYYMLNCSYYTSVLIECGFISNAEEERLLNSSAYKKQLVEAITRGVLLYLGNTSI